MIRKQILDLAVNTAKSSDHKQNLAAVIFKKKTIISASCNYTSSHRRRLHPKFSRYPTSVHAEVSAIIKAKTDLKGCSMLVVRINRNDKFLLAKPCQWCMAYIQHVGIKKLYFSLSEYPYICEYKIRQ
jgi:deoxycytidylate deaminase